MNVTFTRSELRTLKKMGLNQYDIKRIRRYLKTEWYSFAKEIEEEKRRGRDRSKW